MTNRRSGFTLIELLVVIAIIAILASILVPSLSTSLERARQVLCGGNIRQIGMAAQAFSNDSRGRNPDALKWVLSPSSNYTAVEWSKRENVRNGQLFPYMNESMQSYVCPSFLRVYKTNPNISHLTPYVTYSMNEYFKESPPWNGFNLTFIDIAYPTALGLFSDENPFLTKYNQNVINNLAMGVGVYNRRSDVIDSLATFHSPPGGNIAEGKSNVCFADGHVTLEHANDTKEIFTPDVVKRSFRRR